MSGGGGARGRFLAPPSLLDAYVALVCATGLIGLVLAVRLTSWPSITYVTVGPLVFLCVAALVGELRPLAVPRGDEPAESVSTSAPFILALVAIGGLGLAVLVQAVASIGDDVLNRRDAKKSAFNTAQYTLSVLAARATFCALAHVPFFGGPVVVEPRHLGPLLAGGVAMVLVNRLLVAIVVSIATSQPLRTIVREDGQFLVATNVVLLSIGAVAAIVAKDGVAALVFLGAPVVATYFTTAAGIRHSHLASHDSLTGLGNRDRLQRELEHAFVVAQRNGTRGPGLVLLDLDHFKDINETLGHPVGDQLLRQVAARLVLALGDDERASRIGGDEFAVVISGDLADTLRIAHDLLASLEAPMRVGELELLVRTSAGVAVAPMHGADAETLMKNADIALYQAKLERDRITTYSPEFHVDNLARLRLLADLRTALDSGQLGVAFQPQVNLATRRIVGVEALIRWQHPTRGFVPPDDFIPLAENSGLIGELTAYVLDAALGALATWRSTGHDLRMAVNLSARHMSDLALPRQVTEALARHGIPSSALVLEVTETGILADPVRVDVVIATLRRLGIAIAVDDYGTGHASLSYLKRLEVDELKIDRSFVSDMAQDEHDFIIVRSTIALARDLDLRVIAEGIEDEETALTLRALGCDVGQGYHLGRPTTPEQILQRLEAESATPARADEPAIT
ncbi:bifunctional diguanylate cyclase/phosphodiesterase [Cellulomonas sp. KRMCY2]|uniref:putative bifunctional diguanylate cyclase/phosphodiesterase n=1 Tax=Cellulomonas sp. KRMCY2 TaxID=1304865 RepID=UPI00045E810F|nr:bifunctional diguanylate cyclase/phosphodiesterase [Cellulomonas sp. KRMCY2]